MSNTVSQWQRCPYCGGALGEPLGTPGRDSPTCPDCRRVASAPEQPYYGVYGAVEYDFDDVTPAERTEAADLLIGAGIPYRWDEGYRLFVSPDREDEVDVLFGQTPEDDDATERAGTDDDDDDDDEGGDDGEVGTDAFEELEPGDDDDEEPAEWVADEESARALGRLFDAADRLRHHPDDDDGAAELADATGVVLIAPLPFGMNKVLWQTAGTLARQLLDLIETNAEEEDVVTAADALRSVLRDHV